MKPLSATQTASERSGGKTPHGRAESAPSARKEPLPGYASAVGAPSGVSGTRQEPARGRSGTGRHPETQRPPQAPLRPFVRSSRPGAPLVVAHALERGAR